MQVDTVIVKGLFDILARFDILTKKFSACVRRRLHNGRSPDCGLEGKGIYFVFGKLDGEVGS